jgi:L-2-hydroxyglutarate oxidase
MSCESVDLVVIGGGLVGLATAHQYLEKFPGSGVILLEKEKAVCCHQSGRNSGVIHSGIYYKPGSLKAKNCARGKALLEAFCAHHDVPWKQTGKIIVATTSSEEAQLNQLYERGIANGVPVERAGVERLREVEPAVAEGKGLIVSSTGVVDFRKMAERLRDLIEAKGGRVVCSARVVNIEDVAEGIQVATSLGDFKSRHLVNCGGLYSDRILELCGGRSPIRIVPFRGDYYHLNGSSAELCRTLIYPVPNPAFPFLGIHVTRGVYGDVECGPSAVLAFAREGYQFTDINFKDLVQTLMFRGFRRLLREHWREARRELGVSLFRSKFFAAAQRLLPDIKDSDLSQAPSGVRAQALSVDGKVVDDFIIHRTKRAIHVLNAPSPAATSCLSIALSIVEQGFDE